MDLHQLRLFRALAEAGSFSKAASQSHISQPALWIHMKNLEEELDILLLDRLPRGVRLTEAGLLVLEYTKRLFALIEEMNIGISDLAGLKLGKLLIGASTTPGIYILPSTLGRFKQQYPGIELDLRIANTKQVEEWVLKGELMLGIIGEKPTQKEVQFELYLKDRLVAIVPSGHSLAKKSSVSVRDLSQLPFITREQGSNTRKTYENAFEQHGKTLNITMELGSTEAIKRAVSANLGVSIISPYAIEWEVKRGQLVALRIRESGFERQFNLIQNRRIKLGALHQAFLKLLRSEAQGIRISTRA
jgi:DNA-binding transcriptional LysR family regulator